MESLAYQTYDVIEAMQQDSGLQIHTLKVDGGASRNDFLLQFQADVLDCEVKRSLISETTALGAAYLAGLASGYWKNKEEIQAQFQYGGRFTPNKDEALRIQRLQGWKKAIDSVLCFHEE